MRFLWQYHKYLILFFLALSLQIIFWLNTNSFKSSYQLLPNIPNQKLTKTLALGDEEFLFRILSLRIQNAGDIYAGYTPLKYYDYQHLTKWFKYLDQLNSDSRVSASLASYVYSNIKDKHKTRILISYLEDKARLDIDKNWWWAFQAIYLARSIKDYDKEMELAKLLASNQDPNAPLWTKQIPAFIYAKNSQGCLAFYTIKAIADDLNNKNIKISVDDMNFIKYFINNRLKKLKNNKFDPNKCKNAKLSR